jgi:hypothetical protein
VRQPDCTGHVANQSDRANVGWRELLEDVAELGISVKHTRSRLLIHRLVERYGPVEVHSSDIVQVTKLVTTAAASFAQILLIDDVSHGVGILYLRSP